MPFRSQAQRRFMYSQHPDVARRWEKETPKGKLPDKKESEEMPDMKKVFEAKKKGEKKKEPKKEFGGPGKETEVDCVPDPVLWRDSERQSTDGKKVAQEIERFLGKKEDK